MVKQKNICLPHMLALILVLFLGVGCLHAQSGTQGTVTVTVQDDSGGVVPDAELSLVALATNDARHARTKSIGNATFSNLPIGEYKLLVKKAGYQSSLLPAVEVEAAKSTDIRISLKVGASTETVTVASSAAPILETSQNSLVTVIDPQFIENLPMVDRDVSYFATLVPGYAGQPGLNTSASGGASGGYGSWDGKVAMDGGSDIDGVPQSPSRGKGNGIVGSGVEARIENIAEASVQVDQIDVDQGFGQSSMQVSFVTRSGTNDFHGRIFADLQNDGLNANQWLADSQGVAKQKLIYFDWGGSAGGHIIRDKLFYYGTFATRTIPGNYTSTATTLSSAAQAGNFSWIWTDANGNNQTSTANVYTLAQAQSVTDAPDANVASEIALINQNAIPSGKLITSNTDSNVNTLSWKENNPQRFYFPLARLDYNMSPNVRMGLSWTMTKVSLPDLWGPYMPGSSFSSQTTGYEGNQYVLSYRLDWNLTPTIINEFHAGFNYNKSCDSCEAPKTYMTAPDIAWNLGTSGQQYYTPQSSENPMIILSDTVNWQKKAHTIKFGFSGYREQDHYWNPPLGYWNISLGMNSADPANNAFTTATLPNANANQVGEAAALYATLTGRVSSISTQHAYNPKTGTYGTGVGTYTLDELSLAWGLYAQDSWRVTPHVTVNYGMRWDFTGDNHDLTGAYHNVSPDSIYGPTAVGQLFDPGVMNGNMNPVYKLNPHAYDPWNVSPQPQVGIAWNPNFSEGKLGRIFGGSNTVFRSGFSLKKFTEPYQSYWNFASDYGSFFYNSSAYTSGSVNASGHFKAGTVKLANVTGNNYLSTAVSNNFSTTPTSWVTTVPESAYTFQSSQPGIVGMDPHIPEPTILSWNFGVQRQMGATRAVEVRYVANRSYHQWLAINPNEVNIIENGFAAEFKKAQANQKINYANLSAANPNAGLTLSATPFGNLGYAGEQNLPIMTQAFAGDPLDSYNELGDFSNYSYTNLVANGAAGSAAYNLVTNTSMGTLPLCNLLGASFTPCSNVFGYTGTGNYPLNFFQANPYAGGQGTGYLTGIGYSTYESLQTEFRQQQWHGLQMEANYVWSHSLGNGGGTNAGGGGGALGGHSPIMTLHNLHMNYRPTPFDIRHVLHVNGTYALPVGRGKTWLNNNGILSRVAGNWVIGSIVTLQTGMPTQMTGGYNTYNDYSDGGLTFSNGLDVHKLQKAVGVHRLSKSQIAGLSGAPNYVLMIDPKYLANATTGGANSNYINSNSTPGTYGSIPYLYGPHGFYQDMSFSKDFPIFKDVKFKLQSEMINVWNHPVFGNVGGIGDVGVTDTTFGELNSPSNTARAMDIRINIEF
jgi:hypothetical protein